MTLSSLNIKLIDISKTLSGVVVHKTIKGNLHERFFALKVYGGIESALYAAHDFIDQLEHEACESADYDRMTGLSGVGWYCRPSSIDPEMATHIFTVIAVGRDPSSPCSFGVLNTGLWHAYLMAAQYPLSEYHRPGSGAELHDRFMSFLDKYMVSIKKNQSGPVVEIEMRRALCELIEKQQAPEELLGRVTSMASKYCIDIKLPSSEKNS